MTVRAALAAVVMVAAVVMLAACGAGPSPPHRAFPADVKRAESCPSPDVTPGDYVELTVVAAGHQEPHMLLATCDDASTPGCTLANCGAGHDRQICLGARVYRKIYPRAMTAGLPVPGQRFIVEPICGAAGKCEVGLTLAVANLDESIARYTWCRLLAGKIWIEDGPAGKDGAFDDLELTCAVKSQSGSGSRPCYPLY